MVNTNINVKAKAKVSTKQTNKVALYAKQPKPKYSKQTIRRISPN